MINTGLDNNYKASDKVEMDFSPIPDGIYTLRVKEVTPWDAKTKNIKVNQKDESGKNIVNEKGDKVTIPVNNCTFYNCNVKFEVVGGAYDGRIIFHNLTTHPNMQFSIPNFLDAVDIVNCVAKDIQQVAKGKICEGSVITESYDSTVQNKDTGIDEIKKKYINKVKSMKKILPSQQNNGIDTNDYGI